MSQSPKSTNFKTSMTVLTSLRIYTCFHFSFVDNSTLFLAMCCTIVAYNNKPQRCLILLYRIHQSELNMFLVLFYVQSWITLQYFYINSRKVFHIQLKLHIKGCTWNSTANMFYCAKADSRQKDIHLKCSWKVSFSSESCFLLTSTKPMAHLYLTDIILNTRTRINTRGVSNAK